MTPAEFIAQVRTEHRPAGMRGSAERCTQSTNLWPCSTERLARGLEAVLGPETDDLFAAVHDAIGDSP